MPLAHGYSHETIGLNIEEMIASGRPRQQAIAAALTAARASWRERHPVGRFPGHLERKNGKRKNRAVGVVASSAGSRIHSPWIGPSIILRRKIEELNRRLVEEFGPDHRLVVMGRGQTIFDG